MFADASVPRRVRCALAAQYRTQRLLLLAACLEAGGEALVRLGLQGNTLGARIGLLVFGAVVLFAYGVAVNALPWDFGCLLGVYVTLFYVLAQVVNATVFGTRPETCPSWREARSSWREG